MLGDVSRKLSIVDSLFKCHLSHVIFVLPLVFEMHTTSSENITRERSYKERENQENNHDSTEKYWHKVFARSRS